MNSFVPRPISFRGNIQSNLNEAKAQSQAWIQTIASSQETIQGIREDYTNAVTTTTGFFNNLKSRLPEKQSALNQTILGIGIMGLGYFAKTGSNQWLQTLFILGGSKLASNNLNRFFSIKSVQGKLSLAFSELLSGSLMQKSLLGRLLLALGVVELNSGVLRYFEKQTFPTDDNRQARIKRGAWEMLAGVASVLVSNQCVSSLSRVSQSVVGPAMALFSLSTLVHAVTNLRQGFRQ